MSPTIVTNIGAPQGCVLSPVLFTLYTADCRSVHDNCKIVKYADDTAIVGLINKRGDNKFYSENVNLFVNWCADNFLILNVTKTKEMIIDFGTKEYIHEPTVINNTNVELVKSYKYLGVIIDDKLKWNENIELICSKVRKQMYFLRKLKEFDVCSSVLRLFFDSVIFSVLCYGLVCWFGNLPVYLISVLERLEKIGSKIINDGIRHTVNNEYCNRIVSLSNRILSNSEHPIRVYYEVLRSGVRLKSLKCKTNRFKNSFVPLSIVHINDLHVDRRTKTVDLIKTV
jgi:hypothetical protein